MADTSCVATHMPLSATAWLWTLSACDSHADCFAGFKLWSRLLELSYCLLQQIGLPMIETCHVDFWRDGDL